MAHVVEVDQSGKFEDTRQNTVLAFANGITWSMLIPKAEKRVCLAALREQGVSESPAVIARLFATALFFLLQEHLSQIYRAVIDIEYTGNEAQIKEHLLNLLHRAGKKAEAHQIHFWRIGKQSPAHEAAILTLQGNRKPNRVLSSEEVLREFRTKKSGTPENGGNRSSQTDWIPDGSYDTQFRMIIA